MDIEKLATAAVVASISKTDVLSPYIKEGDTEPSWDGSIYIYQTTKKKKENLKRVPVQVKGTISNDHSSDKIEFDVSVVDLNNYHNNGGCVYFVVYLDANGENPKIYYTSLLPFKIKQILQDTKKEQQTKRIEFEVFPSESDKKVATLLAFHADMEKQASFIHAPVLSVEEYEKQGLVEEYSFTVMGYGKNRDFRDWIFQTDLYLYAKIKGSPVLHPVELMSRNLHFGQCVDAFISVDGKQYYNSFQRVLTKNDISVLIGHSCNWVISKVGNDSKITFTPTTNLRHIVTDYEFILAVYEHDGFEINGDKLQFDCKAMFPSDRVRNIKENLEYAKKIEQLFDILRLEKNYDLAKMTQDERTTTARLIRGLVDEESLQFSSIAESTSIAKVDFAGNKILLEFEKTDTSDSFRIFDFFNGKAVFWFSNPNEPNGSRIFTSRYSTVLHASEFEEVGNIDYERILEDFEAYNDEINYNAQNQTLLEMIKAYDNSNDQRIDILEYAERLSSSLLKRQKDDNGNNLPLHVLNALQISKRKRNLTKEEQKAVFIIAEDLHQSPEMRTGAYLLLDNQLAAEAQFAQMLPDAQEIFKTYPIYRFWKKE